MASGEVWLLFGCSADSLSPLSLSLSAGGRERKYFWVIGPFNPCWLAACSPIVKSTMRWQIRCGERAGPRRRGDGAAARREKRKRKVYVDLLLAGA
jgi:hypothetical protein